MANLSTSAADNTCPGNRNEEEKFCVPKDRHKPNQMPTKNTWVLERNIIDPYNCLADKMTYLGQSTPSIGRNLCISMPKQNIAQDTLEID